MAIAQRMTHADLMQQPEDDCLHEPVRGEIIRMPPPAGEHGVFEVWTAGCSIYRPGLPKSFRSSVRIFT